MSDGAALLLLEAWSAADDADGHLVTEKGAFHIQREKERVTR